MRRQAATPADMEGLWEGNNQPLERSQSPTKWPSVLATRKRKKTCKQIGANKRSKLIC